MAKTMGDLLFWAWFVGGAPLAFALIRRAVEWSMGATRARTTGYDGYDPLQMEGLPFSPFEL
jgi:hypothetical protein